jgi:hypothetical protein
LPAATLQILPRPRAADLSAKVTITRAIKRACSSARAPLCASFSRRPFQIARHRNLQTKARHPIPLRHALAYLRRAPQIHLPEEKKTCQIKNLVRISPLWKSVFLYF